MNVYFNDGLTSKTREIGSGRNKTFFLRKLRKFAIWYFNDKFGLTLNLFGLVVMVI